MEVFWSEDARWDYDQNIAFLIREWSVEAAEGFKHRVNQVLNFIKQTPQLYPISEFRGLRRAVITRQITLYYRVENESIVLVRFWNTYQNPDNIEFFA